MAKQIEGVYENIIACATKEFLNKGYADASLRTIATEAHTTTGSIYTRFGDKEGLFEAIVGKHYNKIISMYRTAQNEFASLPEESQPDNMASISGNCMYDGLLYCYDNLDVFKLILLKSEGTKFSHMIDEMVEIEAEATHKYLNVLKRLGKPSPKIDTK
ncbi:MAG: TetR/AcrR family transcriptional regulator, partial [Ruminococcus bromii]